MAASTLAGRRDLQLAAFSITIPHHTPNAISSSSSSAAALVSPSPTTATHPYSHSHTHTAIHPYSHSHTATTSPTLTSPWNTHYCINPFGDSNGRRDSLTSPYRRPSTTTVRPTLTRSMTSSSNLRHAKLHKRAESGSGSSVSLTSAPQVFTMPSPIQREITVGSQPAANHARHSSAQKIKPILRKMSLYDDDLDQGRLDLSRPSAENESLAGLGICESNMYTSSLTDVTFLPSSRTRHSRAISGPASLTASVAGPLRPTQPFAPMRHSTRSYTPPAALTPSLDGAEDEAEESVGVLTNDPRQSDYDLWKPRRSVSISSGAHAATPLSQTFTAGSLTRLTSASQSNLSLRSQQSYDQLKSSRSQRTAPRTSEYSTNSARTSIDKAFKVLAPRPSEPEDAASRAANIRAARKAFEDKEAAKERKHEKDEMKRRASLLKKDERKRRQSDVPRRSTNSTGSNTSIIIDEEKVLGGTEYTSQYPTHDHSLPVLGEKSGAPTGLASLPSLSKTKVAKGGFNRFLAWTRTRLLNCGGKGSN